MFGAGAGSGVGLQPVELFLFVGELDALRFLDRGGEDGGFVFVAQVAESVQVVFGPGGQGGRDLRAGAGAGRVVFTSWSDV